MGARDRNAARYQLAAGLEDFGRRFRLEGDALVCRQCQAAQLAGAADEVFAHDAECPWRPDFARYPWRELAELLHSLPVAP